MSEYGTVCSSSTLTHVLTAVHLPSHDDGVLVDLGPHKGAELFLVVGGVLLPAWEAAGSAGVGGQSWGGRRGRLEVTLSAGPLSGWVSLRERHSDTNLEYK